MTRRPEEGDGLDEKRIAALYPVVFRTACGLGGITVSISGGRHAGSGRWSKVATAAGRTSGLPAQRMLEAARGQEIIRDQRPTAVMGSALWEIPEEESSC